MKMHKRKYMLFFSEGSKIRQVICAVLINATVLSYGTTIGWMSPMTLLLQSDNSPIGYRISDVLVSWMASLPYLSSVIFSIVFGYSVDKLGRKVSLLIMSASTLLCWTFLLCTMSEWAFLIARFLAGVSSAGAYVICPIYTKEISENSIRGALGSLTIVLHTCGNLVAYVLGNIFDYRTVLWFCFALPALHMVLFLMMPDSPSYLLKKGNERKALEAMAWLRCRQPDDINVKAELAHLEKEQNVDSQSSKYVLKAIFKDKALTGAFTIALITSLTRELCGANSVLNFAGYIFEQSSQGSEMPWSPNELTILLGIIQVIASVFAVTVVEHIGRKPLLIINSLASGISMFILATWFLLDSWYLITGPGWIPIATLCLCIFCDAAGLLPISIVLLNEIFSFKYRGSVSSIIMALCSISDFIQLGVFKPLANNVGLFAEFYFFAAVCLTCTVFVTVCVPETKKKTVEEIYAEMTKNKNNNVINKRNDVELTKS